MMNMIENFLIIVLLAGACCANPWHDCPASYEDDFVYNHGFTNTQLKQRSNEMIASTPPKCDMDGKTFAGDINWAGVAAGIASMIPNFDFIPGLLTIFSSIDFGSLNYMSSMRECVEFMIGKAMEDHDFGQSVQFMGYVQDAKWALLDRLKDLPSSSAPDIILRHALLDIQTITTNVHLIAVNYAYGDPDPDPEHPDKTKDRHHERFLDLLLDALAVELGAQAILLGALSNIDFPHDEFCEEARQIKHNFLRAQDMYFINETSGFHLQHVMDKSPINDWPSQFRWQYVHTGFDQSIRIFDDYRGFDVEDCCLPKTYPGSPPPPHYCCHTYTYHSASKEPCASSDRPDGWDCKDSYAHHIDTTENCKYGVNYAKRQIKEKRTAIELGGVMVGNMIDALEAIQVLNDC